MTVLEGIQKSAEFLAKKGVESSRLHSELLLAHVLKMPRMKLYLNFERALTDVETDALRELVKRRAQREPLQHIVGTAPFCGLDIEVNRNVLVPRPETELLAEEGWKWLEARPTSNEPPAALDFGTGSGCIAIALAVKCPTANVFAVDISAAALEIAKRNAARNNVRIEFVQGDGFAALPKDTRFDLIVSNPPYIASAEIETLDPEVRDFDPRNALDGGTDGLDFYRRLATEAKAFLKSHGKIMLEFGDGQAGSIRMLFENQNWVVEAIREDYTQRQRILIAKSAS